ncbi:response regulator [Candidatus Leptofilum sp.]|uniref:response regulator n=1 Tax=Candidatus Leptofilum sp. TaxID=3241576 RepID=UPI003B594409
MSTKPLPNSPMPWKKIDMSQPETDFDTVKLANQLFEVLQNSQQHAYLALSPERLIQYISPNLGEVMQVAFMESFTNQPIENLFGELVGSQTAFEDLVAGKRDIFLLENVARKQAGDQFSYLTLQLALLDSLHPQNGFLLTVENSTQFGSLQQTLTQQRNELKQEIARRKKAEAALQKLNEELEQRVKERTAELALANEQLRLLEAAIVNTSDTVIITEAQPEDLNQAGIVYVNKAFTKATGYKYKEIVGQSRQVFHGPNTDPRQLEKIRRALSNREAVHVELINYRKDGTEYWADMTVAPIMNKNSELTHFVSIERDATERKQLETALLQAQKMEAIGLLAGGIAHDFNNVLTIIMSYSDLLLRLYGQDPMVVKYVNPIHTAGKRASDLTYQLLAFSRQQVLQLEELNLNEIITEVEQMIRRPIGEDIQFATLLAPDLWQVEGDPGQISQVIMNLAVNARDAMPQGGNLTIKTENYTLERKDGRFTPDLEPGEYIRLMVQDTGKGMSQETIKRIFEPFFTTKELGKGTGLGLSSVYGIVAQSNGGVAVYSEIKAGTTFEILLPRSTAAKAAAEADTAGLNLRSGGATILLVEDEKDVRDLLDEGLSKSGYRILVARNGVEALEIYQNEAESIDLLLTDVVLPKMSGHELAQYLQQQTPSLKILYMTGYTDTVIMNHGLPGESVNLLQKPFTIGQLVTKLERVLGRTD